MKRTNWQAFTAAERIYIMEKEWFEQLTDAQKAKLKAMDGNVTVEQLTAFCKEEKLPLPDDALEEVAGGKFRYERYFDNTHVY